MGATLGCFRGGPDPDVDMIAMRYLHGGIHGAKRCSSYATLRPGGDRSVLSKLQRTLSLSLVRGRSEVSSSRGYRGSSGGGGALSNDITSARSSREEDGFGEPGSCNLSWSYTSVSGTSGSRMLSDFYNLVLEAERNTFFKDKHGKRMQGAYLDEIRIIDDYFGASSRKRQRTGATPAGASLSAAQRHAMLEPKLPILDRFAHLPPALMSTSSTISSEMDYWSCLDSLVTEQDEFEKAVPWRYDSSAAAMNGLLLFSPMRADGQAMARGLSKSLSPHNAWTGYDVQFNEADDDDDSDSDGHVSSRSAYGYTWEQLHHRQKHRDTPSSSKAPSASHRPPIYFTPDVARNESAVAPMMAS